MLHKLSKNQNSIKKSLYQNKILLYFLSLFHLKIFGNITTVHFIFSAIRLYHKRSQILRTVSLAIHNCRTLYIVSATTHFKVQSLIIIFSLNFPLKKKKPFSLFVSETIFNFHKFIYQCEIVT
jgi:hypothetical protein